MNNKVAQSTFFGAIQFTIGILVLTQSWFIINISHDKNLWWSVINTINLSPWNLVISYCMIGFSIYQIASGIIIMFYSDKKAELPEQKLVKLGVEYHKKLKSSKYFIVSGIFIALEFASMGILLLTYHSILPKIIPYRFLGIGALAFVVIAVITYLMALKNQKEEEKSTRV